ncbi:DNA repair protein REV1 [Acipenser ruthenus]|uniref:DNA repair protein REV1 n=1 Tax=Acipenser ruthenus TaxID=7906 RepID=A0A662YTT3_ACIRT|nr:DNA repair protein REV1 [Acipenser ruthenus]
MSRGGWRKRVNDDDVWGGRGGYMAAKVCKLEEQFKLDAPKQQQKEGISSNIFSGVAIYVNGYTEPTADELRRLMMLHGGQHHMYYSRSKTTHIIATNLPNSKIKELKGEKVVRPEWITDSVKAGRLLSYVQYQLYAKQKGLNFNDVCNNEEHGPGPSNIHKEFENRVMATRKAKPDGQYYLKPEEVDDFIRDQLVTSLPGVGRSMGYKLGAMGVKTCEDLQQVPMPKLQKEFGPKTGQTLYRFSRGLDDRPVKTEKERKSVSAEINYGIRFTQTAEAEAFLLNLSEEIQRRLVAAGVKGKRLTLKVMVRKASAPVEPAKYGGHGICDNLARTVNLEQATDNSKIIGRETLKLFQMMKLNVSDVRGVGMQMQQLVPVLRTASVASSHAMAQSRSVRDLLLAQKSKRPGSLTTAAPKGQCLRYSFALLLIDQVGRYHIPAVSSCVVVHESAECCDRSSTVRNAAVLSPQKTLSTLEPMPSTSRSEPVVRYNGGLHTPPSIKTRLNLSIEIPSPSQIDHSVLEALPAEIREQVEQMCLSRSEETPNGFVTGPESLGTLILQVPEQLSQNSHSGIIVALPELSQVDPDVFSALPAELQEELKTAYNQRQRAPEVPINQQITVLTRNTHLPLKQPLTVKTKKHNKKNLVSPVKRTESPLKNKLLKSPSKSSGIRTGSPQKLIVDFLKYEESATEKLKVHVCNARFISVPIQLETGPSTSGHVPVPQEEASKVPVHQGPNLAGAFELRDIKALLKEWVTSISDPMEEDILQVVRYCTDLIEDKDLEKLDLVIKYMKRLMQQSVDSVWNMAFDFILDNIQVVIQQTYGSTLKIA